MGAYIHERFKAGSIFNCKLLDTISRVRFMFVYFVMLRQAAVTKAQGVTLVVSFTDTEINKKT